LKLSLARSDIAKMNVQKISKFIPIFAFIIGVFSFSSDAFATIVGTAIQGHVQNGDQVYVLCSDLTAAASWNIPGDFTEISLDDDDGSQFSSDYVGGSTNGSPCGTSYYYDLGNIGVSNNTAVYL